MKGDPGRAVATKEQPAQFPNDTVGQQVPLPRSERTYISMSDAQAAMLSARPVDGHATPHAVDWIAGKSIVLEGRALLFEHHKKSIAMNLGFMEDGKQRQVTCYFDSLLLAPGSSLGGARPKASVRDKHGHLAIAKFPRKDDDYNTVLWEAVALRLAQNAGIPVPEARVQIVAGKPVLLVRRFDRHGTQRVPFLSAMSMLGSKNNEARSYMEIADALRRYGAATKEDIRALWRRMVFNILISNTDDHLRNHGFVYTGQAGWRLSPAYDLNPVPVDIKPRVLSTAINEDDGTASFALAMGVAPYFELDEKEARAIGAEVAKAVSEWRREAARHGLSKSEMDRVASAFEHADLAAAS